MIPYPGWLLILSTTATAVSWWVLIRLALEQREADKDRRWQTALGHVRSGKRTMEDLIRTVIFGGFR